MTRPLAVLGALFCLGMAVLSAVTVQVRGDMDMRMLMVHSVSEFALAVSGVLYCGFAALHAVSRSEDPFDRMMWLLLTVALNVFGSLFYYWTKYQDFRRHGLGGFPRPWKNRDQPFQRATPSELEAGQDGGPKD